MLIGRLPDERIASVTEMIYKMSAKVEQVMHVSMRSLGLFSTLQTWSRGGQAGGTDIHEFRGFSQHALRGLPQEEERGKSLPPRKIETSAPAEHGRRVSALLKQE